jgi:hypothetical protein
VAVVTVLAIGLTILGFLLPFLLVLAPFVAGWLSWRRRHPKQPKPPKAGPLPAVHWDGTQWRQTAAPATVGAVPAQPPTSSGSPAAPAPDPDEGPPASE